MNSELIVSSSYNDLIESALMGVTNRHTYRAYSRHLRDFLQYHEQQGQPPITRTEIQGFMSSLISAGKSPQSANQALSSIKRLAEVLLDLQYIDETTAARIERTRGVRVLGRKTGNWLSERQAADLVNQPDDSLRGMRDQAILAIAYGAALRRSEIVNLKVEDVKYVAPKDTWVIQVLRGKHNRTREAPIGEDTKYYIDRWIEAAGLESGWIFPCMDRNTMELDLAQHIHPATIFEIVRKYAGPLGLDAAPHDLRRSGAKNMYEAGGDLIQISALLGHSDLKTTQTYLGVSIDYENAPSKLLKFRKPASA